MQRPNTDANEYPIEASGWDADGAFFVEKSDLHWDEAGTKCIHIHCRIQPSAFVFLRLLDSTVGGERFPVPHQVEDVAPPGRDGWWKVRLVQSQPQHAVPEPPVGSIEHLMFRVGEEVKR